MAMDAAHTHEKQRPPKVGLQQAKRLCDMPASARLEFIAEGLPIMLLSAQSFWRSSLELTIHPREAEILGGYAEEEAAKILILCDVVRCPPKLVASRIGKLIRWFYSHFARLIYAAACSWRPTNLAQLRDYVDHQRRGHYIEGHAGEYILPNWTVYARESRLYADVECYQDGQLGWNSPLQPYTGERWTATLMPTALRVAEALQQMGLFTPEGLSATSEIWGTLEYRDREDHYAGMGLTEALLKRLEDEGRILDGAAEEHARAIYHDWQIPMYNLDLTIKQVTLAEIEAEQELEYMSMVGSW